MKYQEEEISELFFVPYKDFKKMLEDRQPDLLRHDEEFEILFDLFDSEAGASDHYDFWNEHIKYVLEESVKLANEYGADIEIVSLGALLHDIALINKVGDRKDHHVNSEIIARKVLDDLDYNPKRKERVLKCVYNHRSSKNAESIEETCVADADILAHFDNIPMLFHSAFVRNDVELNDINK